MKIQKKVGKSGNTSLKDRPADAHRAKIKGRTRVIKSVQLSSTKPQKTTSGNAPVKVKKRIIIRRKPALTSVSSVHAPIPSSWQEKVEDTKYFLGSDKNNIISEEHVPAGYDDNKVVLLIRDPYWVYVYWEINSQKIEGARQELNINFDRSELIMRVYDITAIDFDGHNSHYFFDINIPNSLGDWYVNLGRPSRSFCIDIGFRKPDGDILVLSRSNAITLPSDSYSEKADEEWSSSVDHINMISAGSAGMRTESSSAGLSELMKRRLEQQISSFGLTDIRSEKNLHSH